jgi:hypothetical protein
VLEVLKYNFIFAFLNNFVIILVSVPKYAKVAHFVFMSVLSFRGCVYVLVELIVGGSGCSVLSFL